MKGDDVNLSEMEFETVTIKIRLSDLMRIERLIDEEIDASLRRGNRPEPHLNPEVDELMKMYHRVIPNGMKPDFEEGV
jgi:hypothetical protein